MYVNVAVRACGMSAMCSSMVETRYMYVLVIQLNYSITSVQHVVCNTGSTLMCAAAGIHHGQLLMCAAAGIHHGHLLMCAAAGIHHGQLLMCAAAGIHHGQLLMCAAAGIHRGQLGCACRDDNDESCV